MPKFNEADRRYLPRWEVNNRVLYHLLDTSETHVGCLKDLSCAGACMFIDKPLATGQKLKLKIRLSEIRIVSVDGRVVWTKEINNTFRVGLSFFNVTDEAHQLILDHAFELKHEDLVRHWFDGCDGDKLEKIPPQLEDSPERIEVPLQEPTPERITPKETTIDAFKQIYQRHMQQQSRK